MSENDFSAAGDVPATLAELKEACPGASSDFLLEQLELGATVVDAMRAWMQQQNEQLAKAKRGAGAPGVKRPVGTGGKNRKSKGAQGRRRRR